MSWKNKELFGEKSKPHINVSYIKCFFYQKKGHKKIDDIKYKQWLEKKSNFAFVSHECNLTNISFNNWWIDSIVIVYVINSTHDFLTRWKLIKDEKIIFLGNKIHSHVKVVGTCKIIWELRYMLDLYDIFYVPSYSRNLISI